MSRGQRIVVTTIMSAIFVPVMFWVPVWCLGSRALRNFLSDLAYQLPGWAVTSLLEVFAIVCFAIFCGAFAWSIARVWQ